MRRRYDSGSSGALSGAPGPRPETAPPVRPELGDVLRVRQKMRRERPLATQRLHCFGRGLCSWPRQAVLVGPLPGLVLTLTRVGECGGSVDTRSFMYHGPPSRPLTFWNGERACAANSQIP